MIKKFLNWLQKKLEGNKKEPRYLGGKHNK